MCTASKRAEHSRDAKKGETVQIGLDQYNHPFFHAESDPEGGVVCIKDGSCVVVVGISLQKARWHEIETEFQGVFAHDPTDQSDAVWLGGRKFISLKELASGGESPMVYYSDNLTDDKRVSFKRICERYFYGKRPYLVSEEDWGYPFEHSTEAPAPVKGERLPTELHVIDTVVAAQAEHELEDA